jgi:signal transduction histidine kinase
LHVGKRLADSIEQQWSHATSIILEDDGPGFESEVGLHMFERRVKGTNSNGRGLGLAFVEAVAHAHGGTVTASNRREGGAQVIVTLPSAPVRLPAGE